MSMPTAERIEPTEQAAAAPRLGDMLLSAQKLSRHDLERALEVQRSMGGKLGRLLVSLGLVAEADVFAALARQADLPCRYLSAGQKRRLGLARLLASKRPLWLLDEPFAALDVSGQQLVGQLMARHCGAGGMIIAATHEPLGLGNESLKL